MLPVLLQRQPMERAYARQAKKASSWPALGSEPPNVLDHRRRQPPQGGKGQAQPPHQLALCDLEDDSRQRVTDDSSQYNVWSIV